MGMGQSRNAGLSSRGHNSVPEDVLISLNNALPEEVSVFTYHPEYVATGNETNAVTIGEVDLSVIFFMKEPVTQIHSGIILIRLATAGNRGRY